VTKTVTAFYHDPPLWVGEDPTDRCAQPPTVDFNRFNREVLRKALGPGLEMWVSVEGVFTFDFSAWPPGRRPRNDDNTPAGDFDAQADAAIKRTYVMNAYLTFFYTQLILKEKYGVDRLVVTPDLEIALNFGEGEGQAFGNSRVAHLATSRLVNTYDPRDSPIFDERLRERRGVVAVSTAASAAEDLANLISHENEEDILLLDLYLRATKAYQDHNHSLSLITYWAIIEKLMAVAENGSMTLGLLQRQLCVSCCPLQATFRKKRTLTWRQ
jgi:hypothetical protein